MKVIIPILLATTVIGTCPNYSYYFYQSTYNKEDAANYCLSNREAKLAEPRNEEEFQCVTGERIDIDVIWIGLHYNQSEEGWFSYDSDNTTAYTNWLDSYPQGPNEDQCVGIDLRGLGYVNYPCSDKNGISCQK